MLFLAKKKAQKTISFQTLLAIGGMVAALFSSLFLCSCTPKKTVTPSSSPINITKNLSSNFDTLMPLGFRCTKKQMSCPPANPLLTIRYEGTQRLERVISFYRREMEADGWDLVDFSSDHEGLFFCHKGQQECAIAIRSKGKTVVTISYKTKAPIANRVAPDTALINKPFA